MTTEEFHRKLTAILSADVQGYSRLMGEDEDSTIRTLTAYRALMSALIQKHRGQVVDTPGDNLLAEFGSVMDAVRCAVEIQEELRIRNADLPENRKMRFRIGINLGDIIEDGDHIYGDGINIAARVEGLAGGGGICISGTVYDAIRNKLSMSYEFMGEHVVKNIKELVRIYRIKVEPEAESAKVKEKKTILRTWQWAALSVVAIIILGALAYIAFTKFYLDRRTIEPDVVSIETKQVPAVSEAVKTKKTIAVLPFVDLSPKADQGYFVDGLSEEILNSLTKISDIKVIARTSSFSFKGTNKTAQEIAGVLGADHILEGSVRKAGNALRITAQLIQAADGTHLWSEIYDRELKDIFAVQEDIARTVANELKVTLGIGKTLKQLGSTENVKAYEHYLVAQGQFSDEKGKPLESLDAAIALDSKYALAWASKAMILVQVSNAVPTNEADTLQAAGLSAAQKAIELEPNLPEAYIALGIFRVARGDFIEAESAIRKAFELKRELLWGSGSAFSGYYLAVGNFKKAYEILETTRQNDPLNSHNQAFIILYFSLMGNTLRAEEEYEHFRELHGDHWVPNLFITHARLSGKESVTRDEIPDIPTFDPFWGIAKEHLKAPEDGLAELRRFYENNDNLNNFSLLAISMWAAYFGDPEFALKVIEKSQKIDAAMGLYTWHPIMKHVRQLPHFKEFVKKIGLVDYWNKFGWPDICHKLDNGDFVCD